MKVVFKTMMAAFLGFQISVASAQLQLPQPSPKASVMQQVGLTDITIDYSSPAVKNRVIWGELVKYNQVWRAGANAATKITFSKDVTINGTAIPKGAYSIFVMPTNADWNVMINKDATASEDSYKPENDLIKVTVKPQALTQSVERLQYTITDFDAESAVINLAWEKIKVSIKVDCATGKQAVENIDKTLGSTWSQYNNAARYYYDVKDYDKALVYVDQSLALSNQWFNNWVKAQILAAKGDNKQAYTYAVKAKELGDKNPDTFWYKTQVEAAIEKWKPAETGKKKK